MNSPLISTFADLSGSPFVQRLHSNITQVGTGADTTEDNLMTYSVLGGTLDANGKGLRITAWGVGVNTGDVTTLRMYIAGQLVHQLILTASQANVWRCSCEVLRLTSSTASAGSLLTQGGVVPQAQTSVPNGFSFDTTISQIVKFTGQRATSSVANSIVQYGWTIELIP